MKTYLVTVRRREYREATFKVEAKSAKDAEKRGLDLTCDHDFNTNTVCHADEEVAHMICVDDL